MPGPLDALMEILTDKSREPHRRFDKVDRQFLSYMLGIGGITPAYLVEVTGVDAAAELAEEVAESAAAELERRRMLKTNGRAPGRHGR